jgi:KUP system potassium uptake protein
MASADNSRKTASDRIVTAQLTTRKTGRALVAARVRRHRSSLTDFVDELGSAAQLVRVPGVAVFLYSQPGLTPPSMSAFVDSSHALHEQVYVVSIVPADVPRVAPQERLELTELPLGVHQAELRYGFMEQTFVADDLATHLGLAPESTDYFLGRETVRSTKLPGMARWRQILFALMARNATDVATYFHLPPDRVIEIGLPVDI